MSTENTDPNVINTPNTPDVEELVKQRVAEALKPIKEKLDAAYSQRDEALKVKAELEQKEKDREIERLKAEGKQKEAYELQLAEANAKTQAQEKRITELTRDLELRNALSAYTFRNDKSAAVAFNDIVSELIRGDDGVWKHKSGTPIVDFVKTYAADEANQFMFKQKVNSGGGSGGSNPNPPGGSEKKSLYQMSQAEVIELAKQGKLPRSS